MSSSPHIMFAGGGAAGHFFPGISVAEKLIEQVPEATISFAGPGKAREKHAARAAGCDYVTVPSQPLPQNPLQVLRFLTDNLAGYCAAKWILHERRVSMVVGLGGYTSTAMVRAAAERGIPFILLEQNAIPSRTTRWLSRAATMVCAAFEEVRPHLHVQAPVLVTGCPTRPAFEECYLQKNQGTATTETVSLTGYQLEGQKRLVVLGGACGARSLNVSVPSALGKLKECLTDWQIVHQTGDGQLQETEQRYRDQGIDALVVTCVDEIASLLFASDLVVSRASGTTLAELALSGTPAVLVPYAQSAEDQQLANAKAFAAAKACRWVDERSHGGALDTALARELTPLMVGDGVRREMAANIHNLARPQAASSVANCIREALYGVRSELQAA